MNRHLKESCESVDASVFSGDVLYDDASRAELKEYVARWQRAIDSHEAHQTMKYEDDSDPWLSGDDMMGASG